MHGRIERERAACNSGYWGATQRFTTRAAGSCGQRQGLPEGHAQGSRNASLYAAAASRMAMTEARLMPKSRATWETVCPS